MVLMIKSHSDTEFKEYFLMRKVVVKAKPRNERVDYNVYSTQVGINPNDTDMKMWIPHDEAAKVLKKYNALLARYAKLRKTQRGDTK